MRSWGAARGPPRGGGRCSEPLFPGKNPHGLLLQPGLSGQLPRAHTHGQMGPKPSGSWRASCNGAASPRPWDGEGKSWQAALHVPKGAGGVVAQLLETLPRSGLAGDAPKRRQRKEKRQKFCSGVAADCG